MITVESILRFTGKNKVLLIFRDGDRVIGRIFAKDVNCITTKIAHFECIFGKRVVWA